MKRKGTNRILPALLFVLILAFLGLFILKEPALTGFIIYAEEIGTLNWTFDDKNDFSYDPSLIEISNGNAKLVSTTTYIYWNTSTETDYSITLALYDPSDKTDKVNSIDNKKHEAKEDKLFEVFFPDELSSGDIVSLYIGDGDETDIYLCKIGIVCSTPDYGSVSYDGEEGWYNITISGLQSPTKIINIVTNDDVEFDYITSTKGDITKALYNPSDKTSKIQSKDDDKFEVNKNKLFNVIFDNKLDNGDIISFYINNGNQGDVYLCDYGDDCSIPGYGLVNFDGNEGWFNLTISGLSSPKDAININPDKDMKFDYIKAAHIDITKHSSTNIFYPASASIETKDISIAGLSSFLNFYKNELLNGQNIIYYYSIDSGSSWNSMPSNSNLSEAPISNGKIRIKADIAANGIETPFIYDFAISYLTQICNEDWNVTYGACLLNDTKLKYYIDKNECGTKNNLPSDSGTYESCDYCKPNWVCMSYGDCLQTNEKVCKEVNDKNNCFNATHLDSDKYNLDYNEFNQSCIYDDVQNETSIIQNETKLLIDKKQESNVLLELTSKFNISANSISIAEYSANSKNSTPSMKELGKYIDITADDAIRQNLTSITIRIYYADEDIENANLDEETLKIHYFNDTSSQWQVLNSTVNTTGNYVEVTIEHLSTFGIFGEEKESQSSESSGSSSGGSGGGGGGGGKTRTIKKSESAEEKLVATEIKGEIKKSQEIKESKEIEKECDYKISVSIPEHVSFVEQDYINGIIYNLGSCNIENLDIDISPELKDIIAIESQKSGNININESVEFLLLKKLENKTNLLIQGFNIKLPENVKTYNGILTFGAIVNEQLAFEEKIKVKVDLLESASIISLIGSKAVIFFVVLALFAVAIFAFYSKFSRKKARKLTREQIDEIEEKVQEAGRRYQNGKK